MIARRWLVPAALVVALLQIGFLASMIAGRAAVLRDGHEVTLAVEPVDPRDLLRGDYVTLAYNISRVPADLFGEMPEESGDEDDRTVYVRLKTDDDGVFQPVAARFGQPPEPAPAEGEVDVRGMTQPRWSARTHSVSVRYGIERFYVPEGEGREIERNLAERSFRMKVAVAKDGTAQIKSFHDGETLLYAEPLY
ncbi:MAG TPA: GDYXXLXY domain-containing protein [Aquamicrobium sp.]|nr:GDYXXLXY domain-containing protein [Aquamicrobium sp.]